MAQSANITLAAGEWTQLTNADVSAIRVQNLGGSFVRIHATTGETAPTSVGGAFRVGAGDLLAANVALADLFPGVTAGYRVWAITDYPVTVSVSHA